MINLSKFLGKKINHLPTSSFAPLHISIYFPALSTQIEAFIYKSPLSMSILCSKPLSNKKQALALEETVFKKTIATKEGVTAIEQEGYCNREKAQTMRSSNK